MKIVKAKYLVVGLLGICVAGVVVGAIQQDTEPTKSQQKAREDRKKDADKQKPSGDKHSRHRRFQPEQFERPERAKWQKPEELVARMKLRAGDMVADIGAGSGYFTRRFAREVGPRGYVYAVDIDERMLRHLHGEAKRRKLENIVTVLAAEDNPMLAPGSVDMIFICNTIHHVSGRDAYYRHIVRALKPGGRFVVVDFFKKKLPIGPPPKMKIAKDAMVAEVTAAGLMLVDEEAEEFPYQYVLVFERREEK